MNWEDLRFFLAISKAGTISKAAKDLMVDQATVSRRLASLEGSLGGRLFIRLPRSARLTPMGAKVLTQIEEMESLALSVERQMLSETNIDRTKISLTAPPMLSKYFFAKNMNFFIRANPGTLLSVKSEPHFVSLSRLEADMAVRLSMGVEPTDILEKVGRIKFDLYAAADYIHVENMKKWEFIGYINNNADFAHKRWVNKITKDTVLSCELSDSGHQYEAACSGGGVALLPCFIADKDPRLVRLKNDIEPLSLDMWIAKHPDRRNDLKIKSISDSIKQLIKIENLNI